MKLLIVIPAYNEAENLPGVVEELKRLMPEADYVIVNDGSADRTVELCRERGYSYLNLPNNLGIGGAVQAGYLYAAQNGYDIAVQFDGDGQHRADCIEKLIRPVLEGEADMCVGSRFLPDSDQEGFQSSAARRTGIRVLSALIRLMTGTKICDVTSGFRAVNRKLIECYSVNYAQDFPEPEAIVMALNNGFRVSEVPVRMNERSGGKSSIHAFGSVYYMIKVSLAILIAGVHTRRKQVRKA